MKKSLLFFMGMMWITAITPQDTMVVSVEELKTSLISHNFDLQLSEQKIMMAREDFRLSSKYMTPTVQLSGMLTSTNVPLNAFGTRLQQARISQEDFNPALLNNPSHIENLQASINVTQPILNFDAINYRKASELAVDATTQGHERSKEHMVFMLENAYAQLQYVYSIKSVLQTIKARATRTVDIANDAVEVGYAYIDDVMKARVRLKEVDDKILEADLNLRTLSDNINYLCGRDLDHILVPDSNRDTIIQQINVVDLNLERADFKALQFGIEANKKLTEAYRDQNKPRLNAMVSYEANLYDFVDGGNGYMAGLHLSWQLFDGNRSSIQTQKAKINQLESALQLEKSIKQGQKELNQLLNNHYLLLSKIETARQAISQAEETFRISVNRFKEGIEKASDMILKEIQLSERILALEQLHLEYTQNKNAIGFTAGQ